MAIKKIFSQTALSDLGDLSGYNVVIGKSGEDDIKTVNALDFRGASSDYYPSTGVYRNYMDIINPSICKETAALLPYTGGEDPMSATYASGSLQIGECYRVTGTGAAIVHNTATYSEGEEFMAETTTFTVDSGTPVLYIGTQHSEYGDCSQLGIPRILEVGDYYYMYYSANTQKYRSIGNSIEVDGTLTDQLGSDTVQNNADYSRYDQTFLAYKPKSEDLYLGAWQKWKDGRSPVLGISGEYSGEDDASNVWLRNVFYDGSQYVMFYIGDSEQDGSTHSPKPMWATSADGIIWAKQGTITTAGIDAMLVGTMFYTNSTYYILAADSGLADIELWSNSSLAATGWSQESADIIPGYNRIYSVKEIDGVIYAGFREEGEVDDITLFSCPYNEVTTAASWTNLGVLYSIPYGTTDTMNAENIITGAAVVYHEILSVDTNKWAIFYHYYKDSWARYPFVQNTGVRMITYTSTTPMPN